MAGFGFSPADFDEDAIGIWPDNWPAFGVFIAVSTQWRHGMAGPAGLDYGVLRDVLKLRGIRRKEWAQLFADVQIMEDAALKVMHEKSK